MCQAWSNSSTCTIRASAVHVGQRRAKCHGPSFSPSVGSVLSIDSFEVFLISLKSLMQFHKQLIDYIGELIFIFVLKEWLKAKPMSEWIPLSYMCAKPRRRRVGQIWFHMNSESGPASFMTVFWNIATKL